MSISRSVCALLACLLVMRDGASCSKLFADEIGEIRDVIANVRRNELLYSDLDVKIHSRYDIGRRNPAPLGEHQEITEATARTWFVSQGEMFRVSLKSSRVSAEGASPLDRVRAFDGETTRLHDQKAIGNIIAGREGDSQFVAPHMLLLRHTSMIVPLSTYLRGDAAMVAHPDGAWKDRIDTHALKVNYLGVEDVNELKCHHINISVILKKVGNTVHNRWELWLAEDRNYLPIRMQAYTCRFSDTISVGEGVVDELREIRPGIWFPMAAHVTAYNKMLVQREGRHEVQWREEYDVETVSLEPQYEKKFFQELEFPDGTVVYEIQEGEIRKSYRVGAPNAPGGPK